MKPDREDCLLLGLGSIVLAVLLCLILRPCNAQAQESTEIDQLQVGTEASVVVPLRRGGVATFDGFLFNRAAAVRTGVLLESHQLQLDEQVRHLTELRRIDVERLEAQLQLERSSAEQREAILTATLADTRDLLQKASDVPWYETWGFGFGVGVTVSAVLVGLTVWLVASTI